MSAASGPAMAARLGHPLLHHLREPGVYGSEERPEPLRLGGGQLGADPVQSVDPGVQGVAPAADLRDRVALRVLDGRGHGHPE